MMRVHARVVRIKRHQLGSERAAVSRHYGEETSVFLYRQNQPHRLLDLARRKIAQRPRHRRNQLLHPQVGADRILIQKHGGNDEWPRPNVE